MEFVRAHKEEILDDMRITLATDFLSRINNPDFDEKKELGELKIEERAFKRAGELLEIVLEMMEKKGEV